MSEGNGKYNTGPVRYLGNGTLRAGKELYSFSAEAGKIIHETYGHPIGPELAQEIGGLELCAEFVDFINGHQALKVKRDATQRHSYRVTGEQMPETIAVDPRVLDERVTELDDLAENEEDLILAGNLQGSASKSKYETKTGIRIDELYEPESTEEEVEEDPVQAADNI